MMGTGCPEWGWILLLWTHPRSGWMGLWPTWSSRRCPCSLQGGWTRWPLKVPFNPNYSMNLKNSALKNHSASLPLLSQSLVPDLVDGREIFKGWVQKFLNILLELAAECVKWHWKYQTQLNCIWEQEREMQTYCGSHLSGNKKVNIQDSDLNINLEKN